MKKENMKLYSQQLISLKERIIAGVPQGVDPETCRQVLEDAFFHWDYKKNKLFSWNHKKNKQIPSSYIATSEIEFNYSNEKLVAYLRSYGIVLDAFVSEYELGFNGKTFGVILFDLEQILLSN